MIAAFRLTAVTAGAMLIAACNPGVPASNAGSSVGASGNGRIAGDAREVQATFQGLAVIVTYSPSNAGQAEVRPADPAETLPAILFPDLTYADLIVEATGCAIAPGTTPRVDYVDFEPRFVLAQTIC